MSRSIFMTLCVLFTTLYLNPAIVFAQAAPAPAPVPAPAPPVPADFPSYIVTPSEDLNPYDLSTMQKSTQTGDRNGVGTLGTSVERTSNIEVNEALQKSRQERMKAAEEADAVKPRRGRPPKQTEPETEAA